MRNRIEGLAEVNRRRCQPLGFYPVHVSSPRPFLPKTIRLSGPFYRPTGAKGQDYVPKCELAEKKKEMRF